MRLLIPCMECLKELGRPGDWLAQVEFRDDGRYELACPQGHRFVTVLQDQKYEILFEIGINALLDGYYREAVASFAAALERFYEFAAMVLLEEATIDRERVNASWKLVVNQSERQLGAFIFLWLGRFREVPAILPEKVVKFRNEVVHKGRIPTREEAASFGDSVLEVVVPKLAQMKQHAAEALIKATFYTVKARHENAATNAQSQPSTMSIRTIFRGVGPGSSEAITVASYLERVKQWRAVERASGV